MAFLFRFQRGWRLSAFFLIALRRNRRRQVLAQDDDIHTSRDRAVLAGHVQPAGGESGVGAGGEIKIFDILVEYRKAGIAHAVCDLMGLGLFQRVNENGVQVALQLFRVSQPAAVRRPGRIERVKRIVICARIHAEGLARTDIQIPDVVPLVRVGDLLRVGRPHRGVVEGRRIAEGEFLRLGQGALIAQVQLIFARFIGEVGDPFAVGRPGRIALGHAGCVGHVADGSLFRGHGEDFAAGFEDGPDPIR